MTAISLKSILKGFFQEESPCNVQANVAHVLVRSRVQSAGHPCQVSASTSHEVQVVRNLRINPVRITFQTTSRQGELAFGATEKVAGTADWEATVDVAPNRSSRAQSRRVTVAATSVGDQNDEALDTEIVVEDILGPPPSGMLQHRGMATVWVSVV